MRLPQSTCDLPEPQGHSVLPMFLIELTLWAALHLQGMAAAVAVAMVESNAKATWRAAVLMSVAAVWVTMAATRVRATDGVVAAAAPWQSTALRRLRSSLQAKRRVTQVICDAVMRQRLRRRRDWA